MDHPSSDIITVNPGSSSVRLDHFRADGDEPRRVATRHYETETQEPGATLRAFIDEQGVAHPEVIAQRVVHGGPRFDSATRIDADVEAEIERLTRIAPLHNPNALRWIRACRQSFGDQVPQVAVFDTAFYASLPEVATRYALPRAVTDAHGIRRYGFHGTAHLAMWRRWLAHNPSGGRIISLQLGSGCSATATLDGRPVDTSMGFSPLEGLVMSTRAGDLDPEVLIYLQREAGYSPDGLMTLLNKQSGLYGLSGRSRDMREVLAADDADARFAVDLYVYRIRKYIGAYIAALGGIDGIVFGGGVGEHAVELRARVVEGLAWYGLELDPARNADAVGREACISAPHSTAAVYVVPVDEAAVMAEQAQAVVGAPPGAGV